MPPKITFKLKSATTKAREAQEVSEKAEKTVKHKFNLLGDPPRHAKGYD